MLRVSDLHVRYGTTEAVRGISFEVGDGEAVALLGPNGAGKTSTLRAVSRLTACTGTVTFDGEDVTRVGSEELARRGLIHVPEGRHVFPDLTVHENLQLGTTARNGRSTEWGYDEVYDLFPALVPLRDRLGFALSGGEQQMLVIGRALVGAPRLLLIDEPSLGLAPLVADRVASALVEIRAHTPMLVVEQNVHLATRVCGRAAVLSSGRFVLEASAAALQARDDLLSSYLGQTRPSLTDVTSVP